MIMTSRNRAVLVFLLLRCIITTAKHPVFVYRPDGNIPHQSLIVNTLQYGGTRNSNNGSNVLQGNANTCQTNAQCLNGGSCESQVVQGSDTEGEDQVLVHRCVCKEGFSGSRCEKYCPLDCQNGGVCHRMSSQAVRGNSYSNNRNDARNSLYTSQPWDVDPKDPAFHCKCLGYFTGNLCTVAYENCWDGTKCFNGGTCKRMVDGTKPSALLSSSSSKREDDGGCDCPHTHGGRGCHLEKKGGKLQDKEGEGEPAKGPSLQQKEDEHVQGPNDLKSISKPTADSSSPPQDGDEPISPPQVGDESELDSISPAQVGDESALDDTSSSQQGDESTLDNTSPRDNPPPLQRDESMPDSTVAPKREDSSLAHRGVKPTPETTPPPVALLNASMVMICSIIMFTILLVALRSQRWALENGRAGNEFLIRTSTFSSQEKTTKNDPRASSFTHHVGGGDRGMHFEWCTHSGLRSMSSNKSDGTVLEGFPLPAKERI